MGSLWSRAALTVWMGLFLLLRVSTIGKVWGFINDDIILRYDLPPMETWIRCKASNQRCNRIDNDLGRKCPRELGIRELACGRQAFIATRLFDPSMSALPIIAKQNSPSVGLFTLQKGT